jgi:hypothetical protein
MIRKEMVAGIRVVAVAAEVVAEIRVVVAEVVVVVVTTVVAAATAAVVVAAPVLGPVTGVGTMIEDHVRVAAVLKTPESVGTGSGTTIHDRTAGKTTRVVDEEEEEDSLEEATADDSLEEATEDDSLEEATIARGERTILPNLAFGTREVLHHQRQQ